MHAHVNEDATAAGEEFARRRFTVPLVAGQEIQRAEFAAGDTLLQLLQRRHEAAPIGDLQLHLAMRGDGRGQAGLVRGDAARLLAQDRQTRPGKLCHQGKVHGTRCGDQHAIQSTGMQHRRCVGVDGNTGIMQRCTHGRRRFGDRHDANLVAGGQRAHVHASHASGADQAEAELRHGQSAVGMSMGMRLRCAATTAWHNAMSRNASAPEVIGARPAVTQSWKCSSSCLKLSA